MKIIIGISGASGNRLAIKFIRAIPKEMELFVIVSESSKIVAQKEMGYEIQSQLDNLIKEGHKMTIFSNDEISANIASGSFNVDMMAIVPTSMDMLAKISCGIADGLIARCASVMIKENKILLLTPRELPLSAIALENMLKLSRLGVIIAPPIMGYYAKIKDLDSMEDFIIGRWFDSLKISNNLYTRWGSQ